MAKRSEKERIHRVGLGDSRTGGEKLMALASRAFSPDKKQNRKWDDDPATVRRNLEATRKRREEEERKRRKK